MVGLAIGTRPDCVPDTVLDLLGGYQERGYEIWLELGLQSAFDRTLQRVNRGHGFWEYQQAIKAARTRGLPVCTHLIVGLPGETHRHAMDSVHKVLKLGVEGLKLHPLHVVKGTRLSQQWRKGEYRPLQMMEYVQTVVIWPNVLPRTARTRKLPTHMSNRIDDGAHQTSGVLLNSIQKNNINSRVKGFLPTVYEEWNRCPASVRCAP